MAEEKLDTGTTEVEAPAQSVEAAFDASVEKVDTAKTEETAPAQPIAGKYKNVEEAERAIKEAERKMHEATTRAAELEKQVNAKPKEEDTFPELSASELDQLKEEDPKLYRDYLEVREQRRIKATVDAEVGPLRELEKSLRTEKYVQGQQKVMEETKGFFGKDYDNLEKQRQDPKFLQEVLDKSPVADLIVHMFDNGLKAEAHRMLLQQIEYHNLRGDRQKREKSMPADPSSTARTTRTTKKPSSIEDAFDMSEEELR